ncbi:MAG: dephospho-CoA kinase [Desulfoplanes sp.]|nr:dephospho-CoA kinase [Desulfoplanes sp.]
MSWKKIVEKECVGIRLDLFWAQELEDEGVSRGKIQKWIRSGKALIDGRVCTKLNTHLEERQEVSLVAEQDAQVAAADPGVLDIVYQDDDILVINKPAGLTVHPAPSVHEPTLVNRLVHYVPEIASMDPERPGIVHRLDKQTSGLMVIALHEKSRLALIQAFADREMHKEYLAIVHGEPTPKTGEIDVPIGRHPTQKTRMAVVEKGGLEARSAYEVAWTRPDHCFSLVKVRIFTGRTHQVRVHMTHLGHSLLGDRVYRSWYPPQSLNTPLVEKMARRQMLHAWKLDFTHPITGKPMSFVQSPPKDFMRSLLLANRQTQHVGMTGMSGCGKTRVLDWFAGQGIPVWSADQCVAASYALGGDCRELLQRRFGDRFVPDDEGPVDKKALFQGMCDDPGLRREVEQMIHPLVEWHLTKFIAAHAHARMTLSEIPLLVETGWHEKNIFDRLLGVFCPQSLRTTLLTGRGWSQDTQAIMDSWQWSQQDKLKPCNVIISNDGDVALLEKRIGEAAEVLKSLRRKRMQVFNAWAEGLLAG